VSRAVQHLKGRSSHKLLSEFAALRPKRYCGQHLWARGCYWVASSGNVTDEFWMKYIKNQAPPEPDDHFNVNGTAATNSGSAAVRADGKSALQSSEDALKER
jgi:putative transposase